MKRRALVLAVALGGSAFACQILAGIERVEKVDPIPEAGPEVAPEAAPALDPCEHVTPPGPPLLDDAPLDKLPEIYLALRHVQIIPPNGGPLVGWDLDGVCTCETRMPTAFDGGASCATASAHCDLDGGIDNQVGAFLKNYTSFIDIDKAAYINTNIAQGTQTAVLVLTSYNGRANDKDVGFGIFTSEGIRTPSPCADSGASTVSGFFTPGWCGEDTWTITSSTVNSTGGPAFVPKSIGTGYVSNYRFVVKLNGVATVPFAGYRLAVGSPVTSGRLVPLDAQQQPLDTTTPPSPDQIKGWRIEDAILGGRVPATELLAALGTVRTSSDSGAPGPPLCTLLQYGLLKGQLCDQLDVSAVSALDFNPGVTCDALSLAITLSADQAHVDGYVDSPDAGNECYPNADGGGPINDQPGVTYRCP